jgi:TRAP-type C4-dicarboxylate transport system permease small subunit
MGYIYMSIPVGSALILLFAVERLIRIGEKVPESATTV